MKARQQNPLSKIESFIQRMVEAPFTWLFPSRVEPVELAHKLERALEDNIQLLGEGRRLAPNVYDIYLNIKDHQQISSGQTTLIREWQNQLVEFAKRRHYTLRTVPIIRLHPDSNLRTGVVRIETELSDRQSGNAGDGMSTQALSPEQLAQIRAHLPAGQPLPGLPQMPPPSQTHTGPHSHAGSNSNMPLVSQSQSSSAPPMPHAWLTIRLPQAGQQIYRIEKPIVNIGRQLSNDIIVEDKRVSRHHAQIKYQPDGQFAIFDLGSTNGITINSIPQMRQHVLRNGDHFTIGSYDFNFERR